MQRITRKQISKIKESKIFQCDIKVMPCHASKILLITHVSQIHELVSSQHQPTIMNYPKNPNSQKI